VKETGAAASLNAVTFALSAVSGFLAPSLFFATLGAITPCNRFTVYFQQHRRFGRMQVGIEAVHGNRIDPVLCSRRHQTITGRWLLMMQEMRPVTDICEKQDVADYRRRVAALIWRRRDSERIAAGI